MFSSEDHFTGMPFASLLPKPPGSQNCVQGAAAANPLSTTANANDAGSEKFMAKSLSVELMLNQTGIASH